MSLKNRNFQKIIELRKTRENGKAKKKNLLFTYWNKKIRLTKLISVLPPPPQLDKLFIHILLEMEMEM